MKLIPTSLRSPRTTLALAVLAMVGSPAWALMPPPAAGTPTPAAAAPVPVASPPAPGMANNGASTNPTQPTPLTVVTSPAAPMVPPPNPDDRLQLRRIAALQAQLTEKKLQADIDKVSGMGMPMGTPMVNGRPVVPAPAVQAEEHHEAPFNVVATAVYGLGEKLYAEMLVDGNKLIAEKGTKLPNGYTVKSITTTSVTVANGKKTSVVAIANARDGIGVTPAAAPTSQPAAAIMPINLSSMPAPITPSAAGPGGGLPPLSR